MLSQSPIANLVHFYPDNFHGGQEICDGKVFTFAWVLPIIA